jgi:hypothetical protein
MIDRNYYIFVLGYDLLHDALDGIACDEAYDLCVELYNDFEDSIYNNPKFSAYKCLSEYVDAHMGEILVKVEELK